MYCSLRVGKGVINLALLAPTHGGSLVVPWILKLAFRLCMHFVLGWGENPVPPGAHPWWFPGGSLDLEIGIPLRGGENPAPPSTHPWWFPGGSMDLEIGIPFMRTFRLGWVEH